MQKKRSAPKKKFNAMIKVRIGEWKIQRALIMHCAYECFDVILALFFFFSSLILFFCIKIYQIDIESAFSLVAFFSFVYCHYLNTRVYEAIQMWSILAFQHIVVYHFVVFVLGFDIGGGGSNSSVRHQNRAKKETKPSHTSALSSNKFFFLCVFSRIYVVNFHIKWSISHISSILCDCVSLSATFAHSLKIFDVPCVCMVFFLSGCSSPQENFSSSFLTLTQIDA